MEEVTLVLTLTKIVL